MDLHVIFTIGEYAFRRLLTGWFFKLLVGAGIGILGLLFLNEGPDPQETLLNNRVTSADLILLATVVLVTVMGATEIPRDIDSRTILIILSKPLTKDDIVLGKFVGLVYVAAFTGGLLSLVLGAGCWLQGLPPDANLLQKGVFSILTATILSAFVIFMSTRLSEIPIIFFTAFYAVLGYFVSTLRLFELMEALPWSVRVFIRFVYFLAPNLRYNTIRDELSKQGAVPWSHFGFAVLYTILYSAILLVLAIRSFRGRQVAG